MRQRVNVAQLAVFHAEEMSIGRTAAAVCVSGAEGTEHDHTTDSRVHHEAAVGYVHTTRDSDIAAVHGRPVAGVHTAFRAVAGIAPRHQILFLFKKRIEIGIGSCDQGVSCIALVGRNGVPLFCGRILQVVVVFK